MFYLAEFTRGERLLRLCSIQCFTKFIEFPNSTTRKTPWFIQGIWVWFATTSRDSHAGFLKLVWSMNFQNNLNDGLSVDQFWRESQYIFMFMFYILNDRAICNILLVDIHDLILFHFHFILTLYINTTLIVPLYSVYIMKILIYTVMSCAHMIWWHVLQRLALLALLNFQMADVKPS